jgi:hypothetical protein
MGKQMTKIRLYLLTFLLATAFLTACSPGHTGNNEISFVRNGQLWTIDPDGANLFQVTTANTQVIGYTWSPDHRVFAYRTLDSASSRFIKGLSISPNQATGLTNDAPSVINTVGIDGGTPIPIVPSGAGIQHSNAWWNPKGNRLLYREEATSIIQNPGTQTWWVSQNDQPLDIARKFLPYSYSIPSLASNSLAIGNSSAGLYTTTLSGSQFQLISQGALPGHPLPASLERILWQPAHSHPNILYATAKEPSLPKSSSASVLPVKLILHDSQGQTKIIATCNCRQFAWSPDGNSVLYSTGTQYTILNINNHSSFTVNGEFNSIPYWSPDSKFLILDGLNTLQLISVASQRQQVLLRDATSNAAPATIPLPDSRALLQPISNSIWSPDSQQFLFLPRNRLIWQGKNLTSGNGLYIVSIDGTGNVQGTPTLIDQAKDTQAGWTYENPDTSFLF